MKTPRPYDETLTRHAFDQACSNLARFMHIKAAQVARHVGISYDVVPAEQCPSNGREIKAKFEECRRACKPFPVYDGGSENTIYSASDASANYAFRFWHDYLHFAHNCTTGAADELKLAALHRAAVADVFGPDSLEARIMFADVAAQVHFFFNTGNFVQNQVGFIFAALASGEF